MSSKRRLCGIVLLFVLATLSACSGSGSGSTPGQPPAAITSQPADQSVVEGAQAIFIAVASNATGYQWQISTDGGIIFTDVNAATSASYITPATTPTDSGKQYRVRVTGAGNSVTSTAVTLTVTAAPVAPSISAHPAHQTIIEGQNASFSVTAGGTSLSYQWRRSTDGGANFADVVGASSATMNLTAVPLADNTHQFRVVVSNSAGSLTSNAALLTVNSAPTTPAFTAQPASVTVVSPSTATFSVVVIGLPTPALQWQVSANGGGSFTDIVGATASSYTTPATVVGDSGKQYRAIATNGTGAANSNAATLTVNPAPVVPSNWDSMIWDQGDWG